jgi:CRISPR/Cas system-associated protein Cas10 (large subunit of type III CRISPR-Cas system)
MAKDKSSKAKETEHVDELKELLDEVFADSKVREVFDEGATRRENLKQVVVDACLVFRTVTHELGSSTIAKALGLQMTLAFFDRALGGK